MIRSQSKGVNYLTELNNGEATVISDVPVAKGGQGGKFMPYDLVLSGYAACLNITARMAMDELGAAYDQVITHVEMDRSDDSKTVFLYDVQIIGNLTPEQQAAVDARIEASPVRRLISKQLEFKRAPELRD